MEQPKTKARRCAIYTRKSSEEGLEQRFNRCTPSARPAKRSSRVRRSEGWKLSRPHTTTAGYRAAPWSGRR
jgi:hypothetical protein